jgi:hypothetical protein
VVVAVGVEVSVEVSDGVIVGVSENSTVWVGVKIKSKFSSACDGKIIKNKIIITPNALFI